MKSLALLLVGAAIGAAAVALFTTPQGAQLRARIRSYLADRGLVEQDEIDELVELIATEIETKNTANKAEK